MRSAREAAFLAIAHFDEIPIHEALPTLGVKREDLALAREIAAGTVKRLLTLKYFAKKLAPKLRLGRKEKALLFSAIYQYVFMKKIPLYAIVDETTTLAKKHFGEKKGNFFHAVLRKLEAFSPEVPGKNNAFDLSLRLSYPPYFIKKMLEEYGVKKTIQLLDVMNNPGKVMARIRKPSLQKAPHIRKVHKEVFIIEKDLLSWVERAEAYVQNVTPVLLFEALSKKLKRSPKRILDLCASPGGKLLLCHDRFPGALLEANDVSTKKMERLHENVQKYGISAQLHTQKGETFSSKERFDLIILDAPCSNSGVYHKRAEARWRFCPDRLEDLSDLQASILENAQKYLSEEGQIWYMTCSILSEENEATVNYAESLGLRRLVEKKILPSDQGADGGFAASFVRDKKR
ncbi:MAG: transcription antitermination factor NusB [Chlamydiota bacterium]